jgi:hypothetical protein
MRKFVIGISVVLAYALIAVIPGSMAAAASDSVNIEGEVGETVDSEAEHGGFYLRYVGDPAPEPTYSHFYQWGTPYIEAHPEDGAVAFEGTLDLTDRATGSTAMIGLLDKQDLESGQTGWQSGAYIYVTNLANGDVRLGVSDGNVGGEIVQSFLTIPDADANEGALSVTFTVDGTEDPTECETPAGSGTGGAGCLTLEVDSFGSVSDSYGTIRGPSSSVPEFSAGAIPGWEAFPAGPTGVDYDLTVSPVVSVVSDPQSRDDCKDGGHADYGFANQGQCVRFVETGRDSR